MGDKDDKDKSVDLEFNLDFDEEATKVDSISSKQEEGQAPTMVELALKTNSEEEAQKNLANNAEKKNTPSSVGGDEIQLELSNQDTQDIEQKTLIDNEQEIKNDGSEISFDNLQVDGKKEEAESVSVEQNSGDIQEEGKKPSFDSLDDIKEETAEIELPEELSKVNQAKPVENQMEVSGSERNADESIKFHNSDNLIKSEDAPEAKEEIAKEKNEESAEDSLFSNISVPGNESEMLRLQSTIRQLREEQKHLRTENKKAEKRKKALKDEILALEAELEEIKIENTILKKRHSDQIEELNSKVKVSEEKRLIMEKKMKNYQKEFEKMDQKVRIDFSKVKQREKELENQLELTSMDSEAQLSGRDNKITELKRKIDTLEFNIENISIKEKKSLEDKRSLEEKVSEVLKALKDAVGILEISMNNDDEIFHKLAKVSNG